jgi:hypothetical protein
MGQLQRQLHSDNSPASACAVRETGYSIPTHITHSRFSPECLQPTPLSWPQTLDMQGNGLRNPVLSHLTDPTAWTQDRQFAHITERSNATPISQAPASSAGIDILIPSPGLSFPVVFLQTRSTSSWELTVLKGIFDDTSCTNIGF